MLFQVVFIICKKTKKIQMKSQFHENQLPIYLDVSHGIMVNKQG